MLEANCGDFVLEFIVEMDTLIIGFNEGASEEFYFLVGQHLVEEKTCGVVNVELDGASVDRWVCDGLIEQFDEHGEVISENRVEALLLTHLIVIKYIARMLVEQKEVLLARQLNLDDFGRLVWTLEQYFNWHFFRLRYCMANFLNQLRVNNVEHEWTFSFIYQPIAPNFIKNELEHRLDTSVVVSELFDTKDYLLRLGSVYTT